MAYPRSTVKRVSPRLRKPEFREGDIVFIDCEAPSVFQVDEIEDGMLIAVIGSRVHRPEDTIIWEKVTDTDGIRPKFSSYNAVILGRYDQSRQHDTVMIASIKKKYKDIWNLYRNFDVV